MISDLRICVVGAGKMGEALIHSLISKNAIDPNRLLATDILEARCEYLSKKYGIECSTEITKYVSNSNVIVISVKPKDLKSVAKSLSRFVSSKQLIITIVAGVSSKYLSEILGDKNPIIRAMPNIAILISEGMVALAKGPHCLNEHLMWAEKIFSYTGRVAIVDEKQIDAVTGLSGSGPAYIYTVIEALSDGGVKVGLERDLATLLAAQTTLGAAKMVLETKEHPAKLKDMVTTPGGTTVEGILQLEKGKIRVALMKAVIEATKKSRDLLVS